jgi:hypothetical protein
MFVLLRVIASVVRVDKEEHHQKLARGQENSTKSQCYMCVWILLSQKRLFALISM